MANDLHLFDYVSVLIVNQDPGFHLVSAERGFLLEALSFFFRIPVHELVLLDYNSRDPIVRDVSDIVDGMVIRLEQAGVTIDPAIIRFSGIK
ncbi:hypothetical protein NPIL_656081 [Nephila pilipes]|uniref:Uncharacterized protein n=1 Tax=Nephila pilipes TaxID=299642 RepID=A0A8X6U5A3_NEPPI|nr:hypothetical protein NPIL_656081 [Nephila pilipes]